MSAIDLPPCALSRAVKPPLSTDSRRHRPGDDERYRNDRAAHDATAKKPARRSVKDFGKCIDAGSDQLQAAAPRL